MKLGLALLESIRTPSGWPCGALCCMVEVLPAADGHPEVRAMGWYCENSTVYRPDLREQRDLRTALANPGSHRVGQAELLLAPEPRNCDET